ncbi:unnamed protein product [Cuscuta europaea]|uniref:Uncharacterized protein n=1 Tax=Cuscuta europaea TaxID=41803 RepID=A0A9P0ZDF7_CUSEU|nr:unnamed protein product [Cuscuta europaea]
MVGCKSTIGFVDIKNWDLDQGKHGREERRRLRSVHNYALKLWKRRNGTIWKNESLGSVAVIQSADRMLKSWEDSQIFKSDINHGKFTHLISWRKPKAGFIKVNIDAHLMRQVVLGCRVGLPILIRDSL